MKSSRWSLAGFALVLFVLFAPVSVLSETDAQSRIEEGESQGPPAIEQLLPPQNLTPLSLRDALCIALTNSLDIQIQRYSPRISTVEVDVQKGVFDPVAFFNATYVDTTVPLPSSVSIATGGLNAVEAEQWVLTGGVAGALPSGLTYEATVISEHTPMSTITEFLGTSGQQQFETVLSVSQPLLKNFGIDVNTTGIRAAEINKEASIALFEQAVIDTFFEVEQAYWNLVFAYKNLYVKLNSLNVAQNLLRENRIRLRVGVVAPLDVLQSETGVAFREEEVIVALSLLETASDTLVSLINLFPEQMNWDLVVFPTDEVDFAPPDKYAEAEEIATAFRSRRDLEALLLQREAGELQAKFAKNQLLPALNLNATVGLIGLDEDFGVSLIQPPDIGIDPAADDLFSGDNFQWLLGFTFEMPLGRNFERGQYRVANLTVSQLDSSIQNVRLLIIQDVRNALRQIATTWERVQAARVTMDFRKKSLDAEKKRYEVGATTTFDLLQFEEELAEAEARLVNAQADYRIALSNLRRATGTLLQYLNVRVDIAS
ncbi:MAG: TolC family protein [Candidatus Abyssobacteria bacterium SURF_5]|uniref:TolC family protein n=1 Tax=Abyssobacteria bacterium (strain SURF_5) TaxID=2093360 RepID=A0A3A4NUP0_ABYX5|nr:MAG: TolC family protein [Candidatus Abyssubacteria bacterium SURF_5]